MAVGLRNGQEDCAGWRGRWAGAAQKMALNAMSTAVMVKLGKVHGNLMVDVAPTSEKLRRRAERLTALLADADVQRARRALQSCGYNVKTAVVMLRRACGREAAEARLRVAGGILRAALGEP